MHPLILSLLPLYFMSNFHCLGMCGPLMVLMSKNPHRHWYLLGRLFSYTLLGGLCGSLGQSLLRLPQGKTAALLYVIIAFFLLLYAFFKAWKYKPRLLKNIRLFLQKRLSPLTHYLVRLSAKRGRQACAAMGFFSVLIPCGQTFFVFSMAAIYARADAGFLAGGLLALFSTPSLLFAMQTLRLQRLRSLQDTTLIISALIFALQSILRALAVLELIPHSPVDGLW